MDEWAWDRNANGDIIVAKLLDFQVIAARNTSAICRLKYAHSEAEAQAGGKVVQLVISPESLTALISALSVVADMAQPPGPEVPRN